MKESKEEVKEYKRCEKNKQTSKRGLDEDRIRKTEHL